MGGSAEVVDRRTDEEASLVEGLDAVLFDLDGVIYRGPELVPGADDAVGRLRAAGKQALFVTNNAARTPDAVAAHLTEIGVRAVGSDVVTSAQAAAKLLASRVAPGSKVLVAGSAHLREEVTANGLQVVAAAADEPVAAVQGYTPDLTMAQLAEVAYAVQDGALWVATNTDPTRPTESGLAPGAGTMVDAVATTLPGRFPEVAGKPEPALLAETLERVGSDRAVFVGDRLDTDIAGAHSVSIPGVLVLTGSHGKADLVAAPPAQRPAQVIADLGGLFAPAREAVGDHHRVQVNAVTAVIDGDTVTLDGPLEGTAEQLDALWALLSLVWARTDAGLPVPDTDRMLAGLDQIH